MPTVTWPDSGELNRRVKIRRWTSQANYDMGLVETFDAGIDRWAKIRPVSGAQFFGNAQIGEEMTHRIWVRWGTGTKETDITGQHVIDYPSGNRRYRVLRCTNVGDAQRYTMIEVKDLGAIA